ncbi:MAG: glycosyltransferase family 2 protein [Planctomycetota bacterium]
MSIAVIMPCHNAAQWVGRALRSVAAQDHAPDEVIVIDDASRDDSATIAADTGVPTDILHTAHGNGAAARNSGIAIARSDWVAFLDADDYWRARHLAQAAESFGEGDVGYMAQRDVVSVEGEERPVSVPFPVDAPRTGIAAGTFLDWFAGTSAFYMSATVVRRDRLEEVGRLEPAQKRRHDIDMWLRLIAGQTWSFDPRPTSVYQLDTPGSISSALADRELWFLRALVRNREAYAAHGMDTLIRAAARRALSKALTFGEADERAAAYAEALPQLPSGQRALFRLMRCSPAGYRLLNRLRHGGRG